MSDFDSFHEQFEQELLPALTQLQRQIRWKNYQQLALIGLVLVLAAMLFVVVAMDIIPVWFAVLVLLIGVAGATWITHKLADRTKIQYQYKRLVMSKIVQLAAPRGEYYPKNHVPYKNFVESGLFTRKPDYYAGDDLVLTMQGGAAVKFSEIKAAWNEKGIDERGKEYDEWHTIFDGIFMVAYLKSKFPDTIIVPDVSHGSFGKLGYDTQRANKEFGNYVELYHREFNRYFTVYAADAEKVAELITEEFMNKAVEAAETIRQPIYISFKGKKMFVAIHFDKSLFEINPYSTKITKPDKPYEFYKEMKFVTSIAATLKAKADNSQEQKMPTLMEMFEMMDGGGEIGFDGMF